MPRKPKQPPKKQTDAPPLPWERQPFDTMKSFRAFSEYLTMENRSLRKLCETTGNSFRVVADWSREHNWVNRCTAYDDYMHARENADYEKQRLDARRTRRKLTQQMLGISTELAKLNVSELSTRDFRDLATGVSNMLEQSRKEFDDEPAHKHEISVRREFIDKILKNQIDYDALVQVVGDETVARQLFAEAELQRK